MLIVKQDTNGSKPLLEVGELGYDNYPTGGDAGRVYVGTGTENIPVAKKVEVDLKADKSTIASVNLLRADKYLAAQNVANMVHVEGKLTKVQYNDAIDHNYETFSYTNGDLIGIAHYIEGVLKGNTVLSYIDGDLVSVVFTEV